VIWSYNNLTEKNKNKLLWLYTEICVFAIHTTVSFFCIWESECIKITSAQNLTLLTATLNNILSNSFACINKVDQQSEHHWQGRLHKLQQHKNNSSTLPDNDANADCLISFKTALTTTFIPVATSYNYGASESVIKCFILLIYIYCVTLV